MTIVSDFEIRKSASTVFIYVLIDPRTNQTRYLGKTINPKMRLFSHIHKAKQKKTPCSEWVLSLEEVGLEPIMEVIDEVPKNEWKVWERQYITLFRLIRIPLLNLMNGGGGPDNHSHQTLVKMSAANKGRNLGPDNPMFGRCGALNPFFGRTHSKETRDRVSAANKLRIISEETRAKMSASLKGIRKSPEWRAKIGASKVGKKRAPFSPEWLENMRLSKLGRKHSPEAIEKIRAWHLGKKLSDETKSKISAIKILQAKQKRENLL